MILGFLHLPNSCFSSDLLSLAKERTSSPLVSNMFRLFFFLSYSFSELHKSSLFIIWVWNRLYMCGLSFFFFNAAPVWSFSFQSLYIIGMFLGLWTSIQVANTWYQYLPKSFARKANLAGLKHVDSCLWWFLNAEWNACILTVLSQSSLLYSIP